MRRKERSPILNRYTRLLIVLVLLLMISEYKRHRWASTYIVETMCNRSQFVDLENLIGSLHISAPSSTTLIVHDAGLSNWQVTYLNRYQNVQVVSSQKVTQQIPVTYELVDYDNMLFFVDRKNKAMTNAKDLLENRPHIDLIRKQVHLAIVIPFIRSQLSNIAKQLKLSLRYQPCRSTLSVMIDLIFYHNESPSTTLENDIRRLIDPHKNDLHKYYRQIRFLGANLTSEENRYPRGSAFMWYKLFVFNENYDVSLRSLGYTHFFLMEPDTRPIRSYWLDAIVQQITNEHDELYLTTSWWMTGSIYRGSEPIKLHFLHINGNALYHLSSSFIAYIEFVWQMHTYNNSAGYDLDIFLVLLTDNDNYQLTKHVWHKFRFSDFIQNCWYTGCSSDDTQLAIDNPNTYLVHSGSHLKSTNSTNKTQLQLLNQSKENIENTLLRTHLFDNSRSIKYSYIISYCVMLTLILISILAFFKRRRTCSRIRSILLWLVLT